MNGGDKKTIVNNACFMVSYNTLHGGQIDRRRFLTVVGASTTMFGVGVSGAVGSDGISQSNLTIESFDGTELGATLYEPSGDGPHPAVLMTHGYGGNRAISPFLDDRATTYASNGYVVLTYDSRGFGNSGGKVGLNGPNEIRDAQHCITYLAAVDSVQTDGPDNPRIGMDGTSYGGGIQLNTAIAEANGAGLPESNDRIDAIVPRWAWHDLTYSLAPNGVIKRGWALLLTVAGAAGAHLSGTDAFDFLQGQAPELYELLYHGLVKNELPDWGIRYLTDRSPVGMIDSVTAPALFIHGFSDTLFTPLEALWNARASTAHRLVLTNGGHSLTGVAAGLSDEAAVIDALAHTWLDTHLRGDGTTNLPAITYYDSESGGYKTADGIPASGTTWEEWSVADVTDDDTSYAPNTGPIESSISELSFEWAIDRELTLFGTPELSLTVDPFGPECRLFASLVRVRDDAVTPIDGQVTPLRIEDDGPIDRTIRLPPLSRPFSPGDTLRLTISTTNVGYQPSRSAVGVWLYHGSPEETRLRLPILE